MAKKSKSKSAKKPATVEPVHRSFTLYPEDVELINYCAKQSGLSRTELLRRLFKFYASGRDVIGLPTVAPLKSAEDWVDEMENR